MVKNIQLEQKLRDATSVYADRVSLQQDSLQPAEQCREVHSERRCIGIHCSRNEDSVSIAVFRHRIGNFGRKIRRSFFEEFPFKLKGNGVAGAPVWGLAITRRLVEQQGRKDLVLRVESAKAVGLRLVWPAWG